MTALATYPTTDPGLASFDSRLQLGRSEPLGVGVKRVAMEQLELGASGYFDGESQFGPAVHESRKAVKRTRSLLRLIRGELSDRIYDYEDRSLRETGRMVSESDRRLQSSMRLRSFATSTEISWPRGPSSR